MLMSSTERVSRRLVTYTRLLAVAPVTFEHKHSSSQGGTDFSKRLLNCADVNQVAESLLAGAKCTELNCHNIYPVGKYTTMMNT